VNQFNGFSYTKFHMFFFLIVEALNPKDSGSKNSLIDEPDAKGKKAKSKDNKKKDKKTNSSKHVTVRK